MNWYTSTLTYDDSYFISVGYNNTAESSVICRISIPTFSNAHCLTGLNIDGIIHEIVSSPDGSLIISYITSDTQLGMLKLDTTGSSTDWHAKFLEKGGIGSIDDIKQTLSYNSKYLYNFMNVTNSTGHNHLLFSIAEANTGLTSEVHQITSNVECRMPKVQTQFLTKNQYLYGVFQCGSDNHVFIYDTQKFTFSDIFKIKSSADVYQTLSSCMGVVTAINSGPASIEVDLNILNSELAKTGTKLVAQNLDDFETISRKSVVSLI